MANYPQLDDCSGVWTLKEVNDAVMGGYWREAGSRGIFSAGRYSPSDINIIDFVTISTTGNATDFGIHTTARRYLGGCASFTRGIFAGGYPATNVVDYITISSTGNAADFGDTTQSRGGLSGFSNSTRGIFAGGRSAPNNYNIIEYIAMSSTGNTIDFGDLTAAVTGTAGLSSPTRGVVAGGETPSATNVIQFVEIDSTGNATDFGDLVTSRRSLAGSASSTRGVWIGGYNCITTTEYITIASQGNSIDYADMVAGTYGHGGTSNSVKAIYGGGYSPNDSTRTNVIGHFTIANGGLATDFGDLTYARAQLAAVSNAHGGLNDGYQGTRIAPIPMGGGSGDRALFMGGGLFPGTNSTVIDFVTISTEGNAADFGDVTTARRAGASLGGTIRSIFGGGYTPSSQDIIDYVNFAAKGNAADFGNLTSGRYGLGALASSTRGIWAGNGSPNKEVIDYIEIATEGNAADFGNLSAQRQAIGGGGSTTRGVFSQGFKHPALVNVIDYVTIASVGNATDFGDASVSRRSSTAASSSTRMVVAGGITPSVSDVIDYITISSTGNATDFGNLSSARYEMGAASNDTRAVFSAGITSAAVNNVIDYITIASTGNASDFGDQSASRSQFGNAASNGHGGLSTTDFTQNYASTGGNRGIFSAGANPSATNTLDYINISSTGDATDFGDLSSYGTTENSACGSSSVKGVITHDRTGGAGAGANTSTQESIIIASTGNSANFGNITANGENSSHGALSNSVRGITVGGFNSYGSQVSDTFATNDILHYNLASESNTADFGDLRDAGYNYSQCGSSRTRGIMEGGAFYGGSPQTTRVYTEIQYIEISTLGNASDFGDLSSARGYGAMCSSSTRAISAGGQAAPANQGAISATRTNTMEYITIASTGNATDFGDLTVARSSLGATSNNTRGTWGGGRTPTIENTIDYVTIASTGDASDFGDLTEARFCGACSDGHGGLQ